MESGNLHTYISWFPIKMVFQLGLRTDGLCLLHSQFYRANGIRQYEMPWRGQKCITSSKNLERTQNENPRSKEPWNICTGRPNVCSGVGLFIGEFV